MYGKSFLARSEACLPSRAAFTGQPAMGHLRLGFTARCPLANAEELDVAMRTRIDDARNFHAVYNVGSFDRDDHRKMPRFTSPVSLHWLGN